MNKTYIIWTIVIATIVAAIVSLIVGAGSVTETTTGSVSPTGTTQSTPRQALIVFAPATPAATSTSVYNGDSNDRVIETAKEACTGLGTSFTAYTGAGLTSFIINAATTSTSAPAALSNANLIFDNSNIVATSTAALYYLSTTTPGFSGSNAQVRIWPAGSYLTFSANATNTAVCTIGVNYIPE